jgi:Mlc titration factor MtfA (ptsG expression regulator)
MEGYIIVLTFLLILSVYLFKFIESIWLMAFNRPVYVHFYPFSKKISPQQSFLLRKHFLFMGKLSPRERIYFEHRVARFLETYEFIPREGLEITEEMKVMIAGTAIKLTFGMRNYLLKVFDKIIVFPSIYYSNTNENWHKGEFNPRLRAIVFSWEDFLQGFEYSNDNLHLGLHEFAHALHFHGLKSNDASAMIFSDMYVKIKEYALQPEIYERLQNSEYFRIYAFTNSFEFIAVLLEHFFESPEQFESEFPELFQKVRKMINFRH